MKAMVMCAGKGTRLRPLTDAVPKPMIHIVNRPVLGHLLYLLESFSVTNIVMNLNYRAEMIEAYFRNGTKWGVNITYSKEKNLMGTAGGVKKVEKHFNDTFIVMSGDGLTDINIQDVVRFHKKKGGIATIVLKHIDSSFDYGITKLDNSCRVEGFMEKPRWSEVCSHSLVNTGIYVFEPEIFNYIPKNKFYDFGRNVWPDLLRKKEKIYGYVMKGYWCDVGNIAEYKKGQKDVLDGKIKLTIPGKQIKRGVWVDEKTIIDKSVKIKPPCVIGKDCKIEKNSIIGNYTTIGDKSIIGKDVFIENSIIWNDVHVAGGVQIKDCVIGDGALISENISVFEGSVLNVTYVT